MARRQAITRASLRNSKVFSIDGLQQAFDKMEVIIDKTSAEALKSVYYEAGTLLRDKAKSIVPVATGRLRDAIFCAPGTPSEPNVLVGINRSRSRQSKTGLPTAPHGMLVEYGTTRMAARPFFRPAVQQTRAPMAAKIAQGIHDQIEKAAK
jgi:HK97 gp10 family phage protein